MRIRLAEKADLPAIAHVFAVTARQAFLGFTPGGRTAQGLGPEAMSSEPELLVDYAWDLWWGRWFAYVAELEPGRIIGFACGGEEATGHTTHRGQLRGLFVLPRHQGGVAARFLVSAVASRLLAQGHRGLVSWVLEDNGPAREFHAALGGEVRYREAVESVLIREVPAEPGTRTMLGFAWDEPQALVLRRRARVER